MIVGLALLDGLVLVSSSTSPVGDSDCLYDGCDLELFSLLTLGGGGPVGQQSVWLGGKKGGMTGDIPGCSMSRVGLFLSSSNLVSPLP